MTLPLAGMVVADFSVLLPGPSATQNLQWLGADVIKVEPPGGDRARGLYGGTIFRVFNQGKRSVVLNLKDAGDLEVARHLCDEADVVVEGFRPGVAERLGIGYEQVRQRHPDLIYCSISAWGQHSSRSALAGHDLSFVARSGALSLPGSWSTRNFPPVRPSVPIADLAAGAVATQAILAALIRRDRGGGGAYLDVAMQAAMLQWIASRTGDAAAGHRLEDPPPYVDPANDVYATAGGGAVAVAAIEAPFWRALCRAVEDLVTLPEGAAAWTWEQRRERGDELEAKLRAAFAADTRERWVARLEADGVPVDPVLDAVEAFADPWVVEHGLVQHRGGVRPPLPFDGIAGPVPQLDEHGGALRRRFTTPAPAASTPERGADGYGRFEVAGVDLHYLDEGEGITSLFLHGGATTAAYEWGRLWSHLSGWRRIGADARGHGRSGMKGDDLWTPQLVGDAVALLDRVQVERVILVAFSHGCQPALRLSAQHPDRVEALILIGFNAFLGEQDVGPVEDVADGWSPAMDNLHHPRYEQSHARWLLRQLGRDRERHGARGRDVLQTVRAPVLLVQGDADSFVPLHCSARLRETSTHARLLVVPGGHAVQRQTPAVVAAAMREFANNLPPRKLGEPGFW